MKKIIKWGILGTSPISKTIASAINESESSELIAIAGRSMEKAEALAKEFNIDTYFNNYEELINFSEVDAVYIGLPNFLHKEWTIRAAQANKNILCEKPMFLNQKDAREVIDVINNYPVICMEALMYRYHPLIKEMQSLLKHIGEINLINAVYTANIADVANPIAGGAIRNLGCYPISLIRLLIGSEPILLKASGNIDSKIKSDNQATTILKFANDIHAVVSVADNLEMNWEFTVYGNKGTLKMVTNPWMPSSDNILILGNQTIHIPANKSTYVYQVDAMNQAISQGNFSSQITLEDSLGNAAVLEKWIENL